MSFDKKKDISSSENEPPRHTNTELTSFQRKVPESRPLHRSARINVSQEQPATDAVEQARPKGVLRYQEQVRGCSLESDPSYYGSSSGRSQHHVTFSCESHDNEVTGHFQSAFSDTGNTKYSMTREVTDQLQGARGKVLEATMANSESLDSYETPPSTPPQPFSSRKSFLCSIDEDAPLNLVDYHSIENRSKSRSPSRDSSSSKDSVSSSDAPFEDAKEYLPSWSQDTRDASPPIYHDTIDSISPNDSQNSPPFSTVGLYQRRRMKRRFLRLQSLEEVAASRLLSEASEPPFIREDTPEDDLDETFVQELPELPPLSWQGVTDKPSWKTFRRHFSSGDAVVMANRRPNQLLFPPRIQFVGGIRKSHRSC